MATRQRESAGAARTAAPPLNGTVPAPKVVALRGRRPRRPLGWAAVQSLLDRWFRDCDRGSLRLRIADGPTLRLGRGEPQAAIRLRGRRDLLRLLPTPSVGLAEAYVAGAWEPEGCSLLNVLEVAERNFTRPAPPDWRRRLRVGLARLRERNPQRRSRLNVAHHYERPFELYRSFLDPELHYSCAYFRDANADLASAQRAKCALIAAKLDLRPGARVLDIGCGWGGLSLYLAERHGASVTGISLSPAQVEIACRRSWERGLAGRASFQVLDYRDVRGEYDAIVSVGMFEHVGRPHYAEFFERLRDNLAPDGVALLHTIGRSDGPAASHPWIRRHIFPGGYIPALSEVARPVEHSGLYLTDVEVWRLHYARTLAAWHASFQRHRGALAAEFGDRLCRTWELYLQGAEAAFRWGGLVVFQLQLANRIERLPLTRDYLYR